MAEQDGGEMFVGAMKSIGNDIFQLIKTIIQEQQRREREAQAQKAAAQSRQEERAFMQAENDKMRKEMRDILKANGMETSDKNVGIAEKHAEKMLANEKQIEANKAAINDIDRQLVDIDKQIDGHLNPKPGPDGITPEANMDAVQELQGRANDLVKTKVGLQEGIKNLEAENIMLKNGEGLEDLSVNQSVKRDLVAQMDQVNTGIARDNKKLADVNGRIAENEQAANKALNPTDGSVPNMKEWEKLQSEKQDLLKQKDEIQKGLSEKQGQLKGLKEGKSLEQLQKAAKLDGEAQLGKQKVQGLDNVINGYKANETAIIDKHKEILKSGGNLKQSDYDELSDVRKKIKTFEAEKDTAQKEVAKLEKDANDLRNGPAKVEAPQVESPQGPQLEGVGKQVQGHGGGIPPQGSVPITELETAPRVGVTPQALEQTAPLTLEVDDLNKKVKGPEVGGGGEQAIGPEVGVGGQKVEKPDLSKYKVSEEDSAKIGETPKNLKSNGKKSVLQELDSRGETPEYIKRKRGMSMGDLGHKKGVGVH